MVNDDESGYFQADNDTGARVRGNRGCVWLVVIWTAVVAFSCAAWLAAEAWEAWN